MSSDLTPEEAKRVERIIAARVLLAKRDAAREALNYLLADELRHKLNDMGVDVVDQNGGPTGWKFKDGTSKKIPPGAAAHFSVPELKKKRPAEAAPATAAAGATASPADERKKVKVPVTKSNEDAKPMTASVAHSKVSAAVAADKERQKAALGAVLQGNAPPNSKTIEGVIIEEKKVGAGRKAQNGDKLKMHYTGRLKANNRVFDSSINKRPFEFKLGRGEVIRGWDIGCAGMAVGGKRTLTIPPEKGYGRSGAPPTIPGNATLVFDIELLGIK